MGIAFWCRRCGGRVVEDEPYIDSNGVKMMVLTCLLCAKNHQCPYRDYRKLLRSLEKIAHAKATSKTPAKKVLSEG